MKIFSFFKHFDCGEEEKILSIFEHFASRKKAIFEHCNWKKFSSDLLEIKERYLFHTLSSNCNWNSKWEASIFLLLGESAVLAIAMENILMIGSNINQNCGGDSWSFKSGRHNSSKISKCNQRFGNLLRASPGWLEK